MAIDVCIICGEYVPEGRQVCPDCEKKILGGDYVAVIRCRNCKWFVAYDEEVAGFCTNLGIGTSMDEFCSDGRQRKAV